MTTLSEKLFELLETESKEETLKALAEVVSEYGLEVAANLIREDCEPSYFLKNSFEDHQYGEGNEEAGHLPLSSVLEAAQEIINCDKSDETTFSFNKTFVRLQTSEELVENGYADSDIIWYTNDEKDKVETKQVGFQL